MSQLFHSIFEAAINTPWWVYILFIYLLFIGIKASKPAVVHIAKLAAIPLVFTYLSLETLILSFNINVLSVGTWLISVLAGIGLGVWLVKSLQIQVDRAKKLIGIPGTWSTLIIVLIIFASKYYFGYQAGIDPQLASSNSF